MISLKDMWDKAVNSYPPTIYDSRNVIRQLIDVFLCLIFDSVPNQYKTLEVCNIIYEGPFSIRYIPD